MLSAWDTQYKDDPDMQFVAGILKHHGVVRRAPAPAAAGPSQPTLEKSVVGAGLVEPPVSREKEKRKKKRDVLGKNERAKEKKDQRVPFNFEKVMLSSLKKRCGGFLKMLASG